MAQILELQANAIVGSIYINSRNVVVVGSSVAETNLHQSE